MEQIIVLVATACIYGQGCQESSNAYLTYNKAVSEQIEMNIRKKIPTILTQYVFPVAGAVVNNRLQLPITKSLGTEVTDKAIFLTFRASFE